MVRCASQRPSRTISSTISHPFEGSSAIDALISMRVLPSPTKYVQNRMTILAILRPAPSQNAVTRGHPRFHRRRSGENRLFRPKVNIRRPRASLPFCWSQRAESLRADSGWVSVDQIARFAYIVNFLSWASDTPTWTPARQLFLSRLEHQGRGTPITSGRGS